MPRFIPSPRRWILGLVIAVAALAFKPAPALAGFELAIAYATDVNPTPVTVAFTTTVDPSGTTTLNVSNENIGGLFTVSMTVAVSNSPNGGGTDASLQESNVTITPLYLKANGPHTLYIDVSATGYISPTSPPPLDFEQTLSGNGTATGSVQAKSFGDTSNTLFGMPAASSISSAQLNAKAAGADDLSTFSPAGQTYSLTSEAIVILTGQAKLTGNQQDVASLGITLDASGPNTVEPTPAPAGIVLALTGLPLLGIGWLRRRMKRA